VTRAAQRLDGVIVSPFVVTRCGRVTWSITVDQVSIKSARLVDHRCRAKPSGSLISLIAWLDA